MDTLNYNVRDSTVNFAAIEFDASSGVPLLPLSKYYAIDTSWTVVLSYYDSFADGEHDNMPEHELWEGPAQSEWYRVYKSNYSGWYQAGCLFNPHGSAAPPCGTFFAVNL